jgi:antitoxin MazE
MERLMRGKVAKWGNSVGIRLPASALDVAGFARGEEVEIAARNGVVELRAQRRIQTIEELFAEAEKHGPLEPPDLVDWGPDVGGEIIDDDWSDIVPTDEEMPLSTARRERARSERREK